MLAPVPFARPLAEDVLARWGIDCEVKLAILACARPLALSGGLPVAGSLVMKLEKAKGPTKAAYCCSKLGIAG